MEDYKTNQQQENNSLQPDMKVGEREASATDTVPLSAGEGKKKESKILNPEEDHVAVDDIDAARMLKHAIEKNAREDEQPFSANLTLRKILGGNILNAQFVRRQIWLFVLIAFFMIIYVSNRYSCQKDLLQIDKLTEELKDAKYRALSSNSLVTERCRESHILEMLKNNEDSTLHIPNQPPYIISVPSK